MASYEWGLIHAGLQHHSSQTFFQVPPDLTVAALDGQHLDLFEFSGTPLVVNFWESWCVLCKQEAPV